MDFLSEGDGAEEDCPRIQTWKMMMGHLGVSGGDEGPGVTQDPGDQNDLGDPQGRWDPGEFLGDCLPLAWETRSCKILENSLQYVGESLSQLMLTPAEHKPKYGRPPKFNSGSARCADPHAKQVGQKYPSTGVQQTLQRYTNIRWRGSG